MLLFINYIKGNNMSLLSSVNTNNSTSSIFNKTTTVDKEKSDVFQNLISSKKATEEKTSTTSTSSKENIKVESSTQSLYEDIISLFKTGFTVGELKAFEEKLKQILKMKQDGKTSINEIESALRKLAMEIQEAKKNVTGQVVKKADDSTQSNNFVSQEESFDFDSVVANIKNMLQEIQNSSKNTDTKDKDEENTEAYDKLKMILKMS